MSAFGYGDQETCICCPCLPASQVVSWFLDQFVHRAKHFRFYCSSLFPSTCSTGTNLGLESTMTVPALSRPTSAPSTLTTPATMSPTSTLASTASTTLWQALQSGFAFSPSGSPPSSATAGASAVAAAATPSCSAAPSSTLSSAAAAKSTTSTAASSSGTRTASSTSSGQALGWSGWRASLWEIPLWRCLGGRCPRRSGTL